jgi:hypothetical protein
MIIIIFILPKSALGQQEQGQDKSLSFIKHLNSSSYTKVAEDQRFVHGRTTALTLDIKMVKIIHLTVRGTKNAKPDESCLFDVYQIKCLRD